MLAGQRVGVITNPTGVVQDTLGSVVDAMVGSGRVEVGAVFGPEHGFRGTAQAGESEGTSVDERTGVDEIEIVGHGPFPYQVDGDHLGDIERITVRHVPEVLDLVVPLPSRT